MKRILINDDIPTLSILPHVRLDLKKGTEINVEHGHRAKIHVQSAELSGTLFISVDMLAADKRVQIINS
jgi:hypothetical protein